MLDRSQAELEGQPILRSVSWGWLWGLGATQAFLYLAILWLSQDFVFGEDFQQRPILLVLSLFAICFVLYAISQFVALRYRSGIRLLWAILLPAFIFRGILLLSEPIQEIDIYRYLWDGAVTASGVSPFHYAPAEVLSADASTQTSQELQKLVQLREKSLVLAEILGRVHYPELPTVYPPVSQAVFAISDVLTPASASLYSRVRILKGILLLFDVATIGLIWWLLHETGRHPGWLVSYAWCPLVLKEFANSGHLDSIAVFLTTACLCCVTRALRNTEQHPLRWIVFAAVLLGLAVGAKLYAIVLLPLLTIGIAIQSGRYRGLVFSLLAPLVAAGSLFPLVMTERPHLPSLATPAVSPLLPDELSAGPTDRPRLETNSLSGMTAFLSRWEMNDFLFMLCIENLRPSSAESNQPTAWFAVTPEHSRLAAIQTVATAFSIDSRLAAFLLTRTILTLLFLGIAAWIIWQAMKQGTVTALLEGAFLTLAWFWLTSPTQNPWYWIWAMPLLPFARGRAWFAMSGIIFAYYLRFWLLYHWPETRIPGTAYKGTQFFDFVVTWLEYGPWFLWLTVEALVRKRADNRTITQKSTSSVGKLTDPAPYGRIS